MPDIITMSQPISDRTDPYLVFNTRGGGQSISGVEQVISPLSSYWRWRVILPVNTVGRARAARVLKSKLKGRFNYLRTRICDRYAVGRSDVGAYSPLDPVSFGDDAYFSDDSGFALAKPSAEITTAAARGATSIDIDAAAMNGAMTAGVFFSINDYLYQVEDFEEVDDTITVTFAPPLRTAVIVGDQADFDATALWVLEADDAGKLDLRLGRFGQVELNLVEAIGRAQ